MATTRGTAATGLPFTSPLYSVETSVPLSETQIGVFGPCDIPHGLTRFGSVSWATPGWSETRLVCTYPPCPPPRASAVGAPRATSAANVTTETKPNRLRINAPPRSGPHIDRAARSAPDPMGASHMTGTFVVTVLPWRTRQTANRFTTAGGSQITAHPSAGNEPSDPLGRSPCRQYQPGSTIVTKEVATPTGFTAQSNQATRASRRTPPRDAAQRDARPCRDALP